MADDGALPGFPAQQQRQRMHGNQFGAVRDRLFHAMLVKLSVSYCNIFSPFARKLIEFGIFMQAIVFLVLLMVTHLIFSSSSTTCLKDMNPSWPTDSVIRLEVIRNLDMMDYKDRWMRQYTTQHSRMKCYFTIAQVLRYGTAAMPAEIRHAAKIVNHNNFSDDIHERLNAAKRLLTGGQKPIENPGSEDYEDEEDWEYEDNVGRIHSTYTSDEYKLFDQDAYFPGAEAAFALHFSNSYSSDPEDQYMVEYRVEYTLLYGLLRLPKSYRDLHGINTYTKRIDSEDECLGDPSTRRLMRLFVGYDDVLMSSLRQLSQAGDSHEGGGQGYLHDLRTNDHYHFVTAANSKTAYFTALLVMLIFTFVISMLLRFSHHQIFVFIVDLLHMFENNQPLAFPAAPLLTVILALVGMEAIMSEVFSDTTTAFYVILLVWLADQYDAICCHSPTSKKYWLRFFYMYQFFFYAYQHRFGGHYGGMALITSAAFIFHSMVFFFHHFEMPLILYQERLQRILSEVNNTPNQGGMGGIDVQQVTISVQSRNRTAAAAATPPQDPLPPQEGRASEEVSDNQQFQSSPPLSPSTVFDARSPAILSRENEDNPAPTHNVMGVQNAGSSIEERTASSLMNQVIEQLFDPNENQQQQQ